jgi:hypothetical protein
MHPEIRAQIAAAKLDDLHSEAHRERLAKGAPPAKRAARTCPPPVRQFLLWFEPSSVRTGSNR